VAVGIEIAVELYARQRAGDIDFAMSFIGNGSKALGSGVWAAAKEAAKKSRVQMRWGTITCLVMAMSNKPDTGT